MDEMIDIMRGLWTGNFFAYDGGFVGGVFVAAGNVATEECERAPEIGADLGGLRPGGCEQLLAVSQQGHGVELSCVCQRRIDLRASSAEAYFLMDRLRVHFSGERAGD
jgi:hypothetical protein